jgi:hypothetical protein
VTFCDDVNGYHQNVYQVHKLRLGFAFLWQLLFPQSRLRVQLHLLMIDQPTLERQVQPHPYQELEQLQQNVLYSIHVLVLLTLRSP